MYTFSFAQSNIIAAPSSLHRSLVLMFVCWGGVYVVLSPHYLWLCIVGQTVIEWQHLSTLRLGTKCFEAPFQIHKRSTPPMANKHTYWHHNYTGETHKHMYAYFHSRMGKGQRSTGSHQVFDWMLTKKWVSWFVTSLNIDLRSSRHRCRRDVTIRQCRQSDTKQQKM